MFKSLVALGLSSTATLTLAIVGGVVAGTAIAAPIAYNAGKKKVEVVAPGR